MLGSPAPPIKISKNGVGLVAIIAAVILVSSALVLLNNEGITRAQASRGSEWWTLGFGPYRNASLPLIYKGAFSNPSASVLYYPPDSSYYSINIDPLIIDINNDNVYEIVAVDASGRLVIVDSSGTLLNDPDSSYYGLDPYSVPSAVDLDGDGILELVTGTKDGKVAIIDITPSTTSGSWATSLLAVSKKLDSMLTSSPLVWDFDGDGTYEIVVSASSGIYCFNYVNGALRMKWHITAWEKVYLGSPVLLGDIYRNGSIYIGVVTAVGGVYIIEGSTGTYKYINLYNDANLRFLLAIHSPLAADLDSDGINELVIDMGIEEFGNANGYVRTGVKGYIIIIDPETSSYSVVQGPFIWFSQPSMAAADIDGDLRAELFVSNVGDGYIYKIEYDPQTSTYTLQRFSQTAIDTWATVSGAPSNALAIALADIDGDGIYEVIAYGTFNLNLNKYYRLAVLDSSTGAIEFDITITYGLLGLTSSYAKFSWPTLSIGDPDNDGLLEIVVTAYNSLIIVDG